MFHFIPDLNVCYCIQGGSPPVDAVKYVIQHTYVSTTLYAVMAAWAGLGMIVIMVFLVFNITCRNHKLVYAIVISKHCQPYCEYHGSIFILISDLLEC